MLVTADACYWGLPAAEGFAAGFVVFVAPQKQDHSSDPGLYVNTKFRVFLGKPCHSHNICYLTIS